MDDSVCRVKIGPAMRDFRVLGHWVYCRQRIGAERAGRIIIPDAFRETSQLCDVLAVGPDVGKYRRPHDWPLSVRQLQADVRKKMRLCSFGENEIHKGDVVLVPKADMNFIRRLRYAEADFLVDESIVIAVWEP